MTHLANALQKIASLALLTSAIHHSSHQRPQSYSLYILLLHTFLCCIIIRANSIASMSRPSSRRLRPRRKVNYELSQGNDERDDRDESSRSLSPLPDSRHRPHSLGRNAESAIVISSDMPEVST